MSFIPYPHIERIGKEDAEGIVAGDCYIFPKLDGTNSSLWMEDGKLKGGSRNRELSTEKDNAGFYSASLADEKYIKFFEKYPQYVLYGEWLVPHTFKKYRENSWRKFYVFDVFKK